MLRELATEEADYLTFGSGCSRAAEAVHALRQIQDGTYGICIECAKRIPAARLRAKPEATRCVSCQADFEQGPAGGRGVWRDVARRSA